MPLSKPRIFVLLAEPPYSCPLGPYDIPLNPICWAKRVSTFTAPLFLISSEGITVTAAGVSKSRVSILCAVTTIGSNVNA